MRSTLFTTVALLGGLLGSAVADENVRMSNNGLLLRRQTNQFVPGTTSASGDTCVEAFGAGYETCREKTDSSPRLCFNPSAGDTCCGGEWACPAESFCLTSPYCCPAGLDAATCAQNLGVSSRPTSTRTATITSTVTTTSCSSTASASASASASGSASSPPTSSKPAAPSKPPAFTGAAAPHAVADLGFAAVLAGALAFL